MSLSGFTVYKVYGGYGYERFSDLKSFDQQGGGEFPVGKEMRCVHMRVVDQPIP